MANKKVLIITPFFAPESHAAVFRAYKLVKYLKRAGWQPIVLTVDTNYTYNEDASLLEELKDIPIYRAKYIEPTVRGLKMWLTGKDRTYKVLKKEEKRDNVAEIPTAKKNLENKPGFVQKLYSFFLAHYLKKPDRFWTWKKPAIKKAKQLIQQENISLIYTTTGPYTTGEIGLALKKYKFIKWIADFRDPQLSVYRNHSEIKHVFEKQRKIKENIIGNADHIVTASYAHQLMLLSKYKFLNAAKVSFIPTGLDNDYLPNGKNEQECKEDYFVFVGEYLKEYGDYFFRIFSQLKTSTKIKIVGSYHINKKILNTYINKYALENKIEFIDHLPQKELYKIIKNARAGLLIPDSLWWCSFAKMIDYIALQIPVIAKVPELSEAKLQLTKAGLGIFLTGNKKNDVEILNSFLHNSTAEININKEFCQLFLADRQVEAFIEVFK